VEIAIGSPSEHDYLYFYKKMCNKLKRRKGEGGRKRMLKGGGGRLRGRR
jgi:hypothetical protein